MKTSLSQIGFNGRKNTLAQINTSPHATIVIIELRVCRKIKLQLLNTHYYSKRNGKIPRNWQGRYFCKGFCFYPRRLLIMGTN